jgi:hypothetical protein
MQNIFIFNKFQILKLSRRNIKEIEKVKRRKMKEKKGSAGRPNTCASM